MGYWEIFYARFLREEKEGVMFYPYGLMKKKGFKVPTHELQRVKKVIRNYIIVLIIFIGFYGNSVDVNNWYNFIADLGILILFTLIWKFLQLAHFKYLCKNFSESKENFDVKKMNEQTVQATPWWILICCIIIFGGTTWIYWLTPMNINPHVHALLKLATTALLIWSLFRFFHKVYMSLFSK